MQGHIFIRTHNAKIWEEILTVLCLSRDTPLYSEIWVVNYHLVRNAQTDFSLSLHSVEIVPIHNKRWSVWNELAYYHYTHVFKKTYLSFKIFSLNLVVTWYANDMLETELILWSVEVWQSKCVYQPMKGVLPRSDFKKQLLFLKLSPATDKLLNDHKSTDQRTTKRLSLAYVRIGDQILNMFCIL